MKKIFVLLLTTIFIVSGVEIAKAAAPQNDLLEFATPISSRVNYSASTDISEATSSEGEYITKSLWYSFSGLSAAPTRWRVDNGQLLVCSGTTSAWLAGHWNFSGQIGFPCVLVIPGYSVTTQIVQPLGVTTVAE